MKKILIISSGLDNVRRGYETHARQLFSALSKDSEAEISFKIFLIKRTGSKEEREYSTNTPSRESWVTNFLSRYRGTKLYWESLFVALWTIKFLILQKKVSTIYCQELIVCKILNFYKHFFKRKFKIIIGHGVWMKPEEYIHSADLVHEVNFENYNQSKNLHHNVVLAPHFLKCSEIILLDNTEKAEIKKKYNIKTNKVVLSVGRIDRDHKRMDYLIDEISLLDEEWSLVICGQGDANIINKGNILLGERFVNIFLPETELKQMYAIADVFVLCSINEGFGIVIIEAMRQGLPVVLHNRELFRWILRSDDTCIDMTKKGSVTNFLLHNEHILTFYGLSNRNKFLKYYSWDSVKEDYKKMLS
ncbi:glycosyltransferase family 4 protein [Pontibacter harenae]|uniref:glycosyltransferase family 4 protein n=1 Tax=Pontibacter harenae TaxID=2894083 RepID=UPI001E5988C8|nr:glycosyltransferase family 4 protein [Pontibacter harenae]MCC9168225.1 glycosyltransferase family 4 protein [Pontibacter harenae]